MEIPVTNPLTDADFPTRTAAYTGTAGTTATWPAGPQAVMVWATTAAHVIVGDNVTATTASTPIPANTIVYLNIPLTVSGTWRVSAIQIAAGGNVYARPVNLR